MLTIILVWIIGWEVFAIGLVSIFRRKGKEPAFRYVILVALGLFVMVNDERVATFLLG